VSVDMWEDVARRSPEPFGFERQGLLAVYEQQANLDAYAKEACLIEQPFVKDPQQSIQDYINAMIASIGENIFVSRFARYKVSEVD